MLPTLHIALAAMAALQTPYQDHHCDDPQHQADMNACAAIDFEAADAELNAVWSDVIAGAREMDAEIDRAFDQAPTSEEVLREAQRAWIIFRDAQCTYEGHEARGGSMEAMIYNGCRARLTRERTAQLRPPTEP
jgi:uncharacterized protein YecT (DUF1311 family)